MKPRTPYEVGWNDTAYGINTYYQSRDGGTKYVPEPLKDWVDKIQAIALSSLKSNDYYKGVNDACNAYLENPMGKLEYKGGWIPGKN